MEKFINDITVWSLSSADTRLSPIPYYFLGCTHPRLTFIHFPAIITPSKSHWWYESDTVTFFYWAT